MSRGPSDKITEDEGVLLWYLVGEIKFAAQCRWRPITITDAQVCDGLVECGLVEKDDCPLPYDGGVGGRARATSAGWARVQSIRAGQIAYELGVASAAEKDRDRRRVVVESPYKGHRARNDAYLKAAMLDCTRRGEAPLASHMLYTQFLDDDVPEDREVGMDCGFVWGARAEACIVYADFGISGGMAKGILRATDLHIPVEVRMLPKFELLVTKLAPLAEDVPPWEKVRAALFPDESSSESVDDDSDLVEVALAIEAAKIGYMAGHDDTVERRYGDPDEVAADICKELGEEADNARSDSGAD